MATKTKSRPVEGSVVTKGKIDPNKVKIGDLMAFIYYGVIKNVDKRSQRYSVLNVDTNTKFDVTGNDLMTEALSAEQFATEKKATKTELAEIFVSSYNTPMTVTFEKVDGTERVMRCRLVQPEPLLGRSYVEDLDISKDEHRIRQVDHRTLQSLIVNNIKYVVK